MSRHTSRCALSGHLRESASTPELHGNHALDRQANELTCVKPATCSQHEPLVSTVDVGKAHTVQPSEGDTAGERRQAPVEHSRILGFRCVVDVI